MIQVIVLFLLPLLFTGFINKLKALFVGKQGAPILQQYFDCIKLIQKGEVISNTTSFVFQVAPSINLACMIIASFIVALFHFEGDFILFAYILALGKFFSVIAAMDTGSSFEGMGAAREVSYTSFVEPALFIIISAIFSFSAFFKNFASSLAIKLSTSTFASGLPSLVLV